MPIRAAPKTAAKTTELTRIAFTISAVSLRHFVVVPGLLYSRSQ
jgi:hypothetical protein